MYRFENLRGLRGTLLRGWFCAALLLEAAVGAMDSTFTGGVSPETDMNGRNNYVQRNLLSTCPVISIKLNIDRCS